MEQWRADNNWAHFCRFKNLLILFQSLFLEILQVFVNQMDVKSSVVMASRNWRKKESHQHLSLRWRIRTVTLPDTLYVTISTEIMPHNQKHLEVPNNKNPPKIIRKDYSWQLDKFLLCSACNHWKRKWCKSAAIDLKKIREITSGELIFGGF